MSPDPAMQQGELKFEQFEAALISPLAGHELSEIEMYVASILLDATSKRPLKVSEIMNAVRTQLHRSTSERVIKDIIRTLRRDCKFPILARRKKPAGYFWCATTEEMEEFIKSFKSQALDELHTLSQIVKHNYPALAGQLSLTE
jgi:hypothetical protein